MCHVLQVDRQLNGTTVMGSFSSYWIKSVSFLLLWLYLYTNKACLKPLGACYHRRRNVFSLYKKREFRLFVGSCNAYDAFVFERPFGRNFFQWKEIKCVNPCEMWSQDLFLTLSDHRDESVRVMGVLGSPGRDCALSREVSALQNMNLPAAFPELPTGVWGCAQTATASLPGNHHQRGSLFKGIETNLSWD